MEYTVFSKQDDGETNFVVVQPLHPLYMHRIHPFELSVYSTHFTVIYQEILVAYLFWSRIHEGADALNTSLPPSS